MGNVAFARHRFSSFTLLTANLTHIREGTTVSYTGKIPTFRIRNNRSQGRDRGSRFNGSASKLLIDRIHIKHFRIEIRPDPGQQILIVGILGIGQAFQ